MIKPIVITAKAADDDLNNIKVRHLDILRGMEDQANRVKEYTMKKEQEDLQNTQRQDGLNKEKSEHDRKMKELSIKEQALMM